MNTKSLKFIKEYGFYVVLLVLNGGCGVKGDPVPPEKPPRIGRGQPTFQRGTENMKIDPKISEEELKKIEENRKRRGF